MPADGFLSAAEVVRHQHYRETGWWPGEPLLARYARLSATRPDSLAVADSRGRRLTHAQLRRVAATYADALIRASVTPGDVVLIVMPNCIEWQAAFLGTFLVDAIPATIPARIDAENLLHVAQLIGARALIVAGNDASKGLEDIAQHVVDTCPHQIDLIVVSLDGEIRHRRSVIQSRPIKPGIRGLDHIAFTSSTTGRPKAVMHTYDTLAALNLTFSERFNLNAETPIFMPSPLGHSVGAYHGARLSLFNAAPLVLQERWDPETAIRMVSDFRCGFTGAATPFLTDLVNVKMPPGTAKLDAMRWFLCGGAQVPPSLLDRAAEEFPNTKVTVLWGMTEGGLTTCHADSPQEKFRTTCGVGLPGLELRTIDSEGNALAAGSAGELVMRGPGVFTGYLGQSDLYRSSLTADGYFRTGDLAVVDAEGYVSITGRAKDLIIRGGVNISPVPIEDALAAHPNVSSVAVVGAPDARMGELLCAVIEPRGRRVELSEIQAFVRECGLPKYLAPEIVRFVDEMPRTPAGKIRKVDLKRLFDEEHTK